MITPQGTVKALETDLFTEPFEIDNAEVLIDQGKIRRDQYRVYRDYHSK